MKTGGVLETDVLYSACFSNKRVITMICQANHDGTKVDGMTPRQRSGIYSFPSQYII